MLCSRQDGPNDGSQHIIYGEITENIHKISLFSPPIRSPGPKVIKKFHAQSDEHEISNAHNYKNIKKFSIFQAQISP